MSGKILLYLTIFVSAIVLLNFTIAILSDTYSRLKPQFVGLFSFNVLQKIPEYDVDHRFGALILATPPFNLVFLPLIIVYFSIRDEAILIWINNWMSVLAYMPLAIIQLTLFALINIIILPFAYVAAIIKKWKLLVQD